MPTPDPFEEKSQRFLPAEPYFWLLNSLGWLFTLYLMNPGYGLLNHPDADRIRFLDVYLAVIWLAYYGLGTLTVLVFRRCYYRQRWYQKRFIGSLPLAIAVALGGGMAIAALVVLPMGVMLDDDFRILDEAGAVVFEGAFSTTLYAGLERAILLLLWLLAYVGIEGAVNASSLAIKALALENGLKDARLNALAGQINPHFLFNALNNIRFMIRRDAVRAEESLVDLSEILRHSLGASQQEKVLLAQELVIVERYLSLMKLQMQQRLNYSLQAADVPEQALVPPMIIQMLAENAIKHGVEQIKAGGRVDIHCAMAAGKLCIEVRNSSVAADSATGTVARLAKEAAKAVAKESIERPIATQAPGAQGLGLANISNRLALLYGDTAQLCLLRQDGDFLVRITLPGEEAA